MPKSKLLSMITGTTKQKIIPAIVLDSIGKNITVQLGTNGPKLHGIKYIGNQPAIGGTTSKIHDLPVGPTLVTQGRLTTFAACILVERLFGTSLRTKYQDLQLGFRIRKSPEQQPATADGLQPRLGTVDMLV